MALRHPTVTKGGVSPHPVRKYVERVTSIDIEEYPMWDLRKPLPKLPIPDLHETLEKYLRTIRPVVSEEQYENTKTLVEQFGEKRGVGDDLQKKLKEFAETQENWAGPLWINDMYMQNPAPLPINSNPGMVFPRMNFEDRSEQLRFAARLISAILDYKQVIDTWSLPIDRARSREKGQPLCMAQYYRLFSTYRVPGAHKDSLATMSSSGSLQSEHIIVAVKDQFFALDLSLGGMRLSNDNLYAQLKRIVTMADEGEHEAQKVGILTAARRDRWAKSRMRLMEADSANRDSLDQLERCIFVVCLDRAVPTYYNHDANTDLGSRDDVSLAKQMLHGHGTAQNTCNRWFDKTMQFVVGEDGACGLCYEHSPAEGIAVTILVEHLLKYMEEVRSRKLARMQSICELAHPRKLKWKLTDALRRDIDEAMKATDSLIDNTDLYVLRFNNYGKEFPKSMNMSPDAFMQLALQLTYYRIHKRLVSTYESASIRRFRLGRVDNIRACSQEALDWVRAMTGEIVKSDEEKMALLRRAVKRQTEILVQTILGHGIDNHLLGLRAMASEHGMEMLEIFADESYKIANHFTLSTSQVPSSIDSLTCYGPVVPDGYGACYNLQADFIVVCVSSFLTCGDTKSDVFAYSLEASLLQMEQVCIKVRQAESTRLPITLSAVNGKRCSKVS